MVMTRHAHIFLATTLVSVLTASVLGFALINEATRSSEYSRQSYKTGLKDGESYTRGQIVKAQIEQEILQESEAHIAEEKL